MHTIHVIDIFSVADLSTTEFSCIIVVVLTHGTPQKLAAYDVDYNKSLLYEKLVGKLVGIPKLFFIQVNCVQQNRFKFKYIIF